MARKNVVASYDLLQNLSSDLSAAITTNSVNVLNQDKASIHLSWSGVSGTSTVTVQARNGEKDTWYDLPLSAVPTISGASGDIQIVLLELPFTDVQLVLTAASAGTLSARMTLKQVGG